MSYEEVLAFIDKFVKEDGFEPINLGTENRCDPFTHRLTYAMVRHYKPRSLVEFGTSWGGITNTITKALNKNGFEFNYFACDPLADLADHAKNLVAGFPMHPTILPGMIEEHLDKVPEKLDFAFIDTDHDLENCEWYLENIFPRIKKGAIVGIHDWSATTVDGKVEYQGGSFPEIQRLIVMYENKTLPLEKIFWSWDHPALKQSDYAISYWKKK